MSSSFYEIINMNKEVLDLYGVKTIVSESSTYLLMFSDPSVRDLLEKKKQVCDEVDIAVCNTPQELDATINRILENYPY